MNTETLKDRNTTKGQTVREKKDRNAYRNIERQKDRKGINTERQRDKAKNTERQKSNDYEK